jgi:hypothetical protein
VASETEEGPADFPSIIGQLISTAFAIEMVGMEWVAFEFDVVSILDDGATFVAHIFARARCLLNFIAFSTECSDSNGIFRG